MVDPTSVIQMKIDRSKVVELHGGQRASGDGCVGVGVKGQTGKSEGPGGRAFLNRSFDMHTTSCPSQESEDALFCTSASFENMTPTRSVSRGGRVQDRLSEPPLSVTSLGTEFERRSESPAWTLSGYRGSGGGVGVRTGMDEEFVQSMILPFDVRRGYAPTGGTQQPWSLSATLCAGGQIPWIDAPPTLGSVNQLEGPPIKPTRTTLVERSSLSYCATDTPPGRETILKEQSSQQVENSLEKCPRPRFPEHSVSLVEDSAEESVAMTTRTLPRAASAASADRREKPAIKAKPPIMKKPVRTAGEMKSFGDGVGFSGDMKS